MIRNKSGRFPMFSLDYRSLATFRILFGCVIFYDLANRILDLRVFYTDFGVYPRKLLLDTNLDWNFSFNLLSGDLFWQILIFGLAGVSTLFMIVGFRTRYATISTWILLMSIQHRNPMILQGGDVLLRNLLFISIFLPLGRLFSFDELNMTSGIPKTSKVPKTHQSLATVMIIFQLILVYMMAGLLKWYNPIWLSGEGLFYALSAKHMTTALAPYLLKLPHEWLETINYVVLVLETFGAFFILVPSKRDRVRTATVFIFISFHLGLMTFLNIGLFSGVACAAWTILLPSAFWDRLKLRFQGRKFAGFTSGMPRVEAGLIGFCAVYIGLWNIGTLPNPPLVIPTEYQWFGYLFGLDQRWNMFSVPFSADGWLVIPASLKNHRRVDLLRNGEPISWFEPASISGAFPGDRWRKYLWNLLDSSNQENRLYYGRYLCRAWNNSHSGEDQLQTFQVIYMRIRDYTRERPAAAERVPIWTHECFTGALQKYPI